MPEGPVAALHYGALGDIIASIPALEAARRPGHPLIGLGHDHRLALLAEGRGPLERVEALALEEQLALFKPGAPLPARLREAAAVIAFCGPGALADRLRAELGERLTVLSLPPRLRAGEAPAGGLRAWEQLCAPLGGGAGPPRLRLNEADRARGIELAASAGLTRGRPILFIHAGAGGVEKRGPFTLFADAAGRLHGYDVVVCLGPAEQEMAELGALRAEVARRGWALVEELSLRELVAWLGAVDLYLGWDSGPSHLAAALGRRGVVAFGPSCAELWAPPGLVVAQAPGEGWAGLSAAELVAALGRAGSG